MGRAVIAMTAVRIGSRYEAGKVTTNPTSVRPRT